jgi:uncharacterized membrane protein
MRSASAGHLVFAATLVAIGILGLLQGDFVAIWQSVPKGLPARAGVAYVCALISVGSGIGLLWPRAAAAAARLLLVFVLVWFLLFKAPVIVRAPAVVVSWEDCAETLVVIAAAWVLYACLAAHWDRQRLGFATGEPGVRIARILYGFALIPFGLAHFAYIRETAALVPAWLPSHLAWAYFTGCAYIAAGIAVMSGVHARLAAALSALQMGAFTLLVWGPVVMTGPKDSSQLNESLISLALTASGWVVADSYCRVPWLRPWLRSANR